VTQSLANGNESERTCGRDSEPPALPRVRLLSDPGPEYLCQAWGEVVKSILMRRRVLVK